MKEPTSGLLATWFDQIQRQSAAIDALHRQRTATEDELVKTIAEGWVKGEINLAELHTLYQTFRRVVRSPWHRKWTDAGLPNHQTLSRRAPDQVTPELRDACGQPTHHVIDHVIETLPSRHSRMTP